MTPQTLIIRRPGLPPLRVLLVRVDGRRRARFARVLARLGFPAWQIRSLTGLSAIGLKRALAAADVGLWGLHAEAIRKEMARVA